MYMLLSQQELALGAHHAGELVSVAEAPILPLAIIPCNNCSPHARTAQLTGTLASQAAYMADQRVAA